MAQLEVKRTPDGRALARRIDGKPLTPAEREVARRRIEILELSSARQVGITVDDVLREFPGAKVVRVNIQPKQENLFKTEEETNGE